MDYELLQMACQSQAELEGAGLDIWMAMIMGATNEICCRGMYAKHIVYFYLPMWIYHQQDSITLVALRI